MQLFAKKFYGFNPSIVPVVTFSQMGSRDALLRRAKPGDRIVYIAVQGEDALENERGQILGMVEFGRDKVRTLDCISDHSVLLEKHFTKNGDFKWPEGIPMLKAWRFLSPVHRLEILPKGLIDSQATRTNAIILPDELRDKILAMPHEEVIIPTTKVLESIQAKNAVLTSFSKEWGLEVDRMTKTTRKTVANSNGQIVSRVIKEKNTNLSEGETQIFLRQCLERQNYKCAITGQNLRISEADSKNWFAPSVDRIDSDGHYTTDNIQIVTKAANKAKSDTPCTEVMSYFEALQFWSADSEE